jgi:hypothetical protein
MKQITDKDIEAAGDAMHRQFVSHPPKRADYVGGFVVGAYWMRGELEPGLAARLAAAEDAIGRYKNEIEAAYGRDRLAAELAKEVDLAINRPRGNAERLALIATAWSRYTVALPALATPAASNHSETLDSSPAPARTPAPAPLAWSSEPPKLPGLYTRRLGEAYATHRLDSENVAYASHWYPADAWFGPLPEPAEPGEVEGE